MQSPTHILTGVLIQKAVESRVPPGLRIPLVSFLALVSHGVLDFLSRFTYHPPQALYRDRFWSTYHTFIYALSVLFMSQFGQKYWWGILMAEAPDLDWVIRPFHSLAPKVRWTSQPILHQQIEKVQKVLVPPELEERLPQWTHIRKTVLIEFGMMAILLLLIHRKSNNP